MKKKKSILLFLVFVLLALTAFVAKYMFENHTLVSETLTSEENKEEPKEAEEDEKEPENASPEWVGELEQAKTADQLFVVMADKGSDAYVSMHQKNSKGKWEEIFSTSGYIGKNGLGKEKEGDGKTPVGTYHFNCAFGIAEDPGSILPYQQVTEDTYWSGDQREDGHYNQMINISEFPNIDKSVSEHIIDYSDYYKYCLNINYNEEGIPGKGSAIFLHCMNPDKPYTAGCVAIPEDMMIETLKNATYDCVVVIDSAENLAPEYEGTIGIKPQAHQ